MSSVVVNVKHVYRQEGLLTSEAWRIEGSVLGFLPAITR